MKKNLMYWKTFEEYQNQNVYRKHILNYKFECLCNEWYWMTWKQLQKHFKAKHMVIETNCKRTLKQITHNGFTGYICVKKNN